MSNPVLPENINNDDADFLFQEKLYHGTGADQYEVRKRFEQTEAAIDALEDRRAASETQAGDLAERVSTLETEQETIKTDQTALATVQTGQGQTISGQAEALREHVGDENAHVASALRNHPANAAIHVPVHAAGDTERSVLSVDAANSPAWKSFSELMPPELLAIVENGGNVTPEQVIDAFRQITAESWSYSGLPLGATRIKTSVFAYDRFLVGGSDGRIASTFDAQTWQGAVSLFTEPTPPAAVESFAYAMTTTGETPVLALDAYSDFRISLDRSTWSPRLSVRVTPTGNPDHPYADRYETADFTCTLADRGLFLVFTTKGTVYRATYEDVVAEYHRATEGGDRHSTVWTMQESNESITQGTLAAASGGGNYVAVGILGRISISPTAVLWEQVTTPFGTSNINAVAAGDDRFIAVADDGKIAYALFSSPKSWSLIPETPWGAESLRAICCGGGLWLVVTESGRVYSSKIGMVWKEVPANLTGGGTTVAFGDTYFLVGDVSGNVRRSLSVASIFSVVTRAEFASLAQRILGMTADEIARVQAWVLEQQARIDEALARQLVIGELPGLETTLDGTVGETGDAADQGHTHGNRNLVLMHQLDRASYDPTEEFEDRTHHHGIPVLDDYGKILAKNQTWQRDAAGGIAALDSDRRILRDYLPTEYEIDLLMNALRGGMVDNWFVTANPIFEDLGGFSRIYAIDSTEGNVVMVGDKGRIAHGPNARALELVESPFGTDDRPSGSDPVIDVKFGVDDFEREVCVAISQGNALAVSRDGGETWSALTHVEFDGVPADFEGLCFGGRKFLIHCSNGDVLTLHWDADDDVTATKQASSPNVTAGLYRVRYCVDRFLGVGVGGKIVSSVNGSNWQLETSFTTADLHDVLSCNGINVAVGVGGALGTSPDGTTWTRRDSRTTNDLYALSHSYGVTVATGKSGTILSSFDTVAWERRRSPFASIVRCCHGYGQSFVVGTDAGQIGISATYMEILGIILDVDVIQLSDDATEPVGLQNLPGTSIKASRSDHKHSIGDLVEDLIHRGDIGRPGGVAPLGEDGIVPAIHLPPLQVDVEQIVQYLLDGKRLEFLEQTSPFKRGPGVSAILHDAAYGTVGGTGVYVMIGETGLGWSTGASQWTLSASPFGGNIPVGIAFGMDDNDAPLFVAVDTAESYSISRNGKTWSPAVALGGDYDIESIFYGNRLFVILCSNGVVLRSVFDGGELVGFVEQADSPNITERMNRIACGNGLWLAVGNGGRIRYSTDASHFSAATSPTTVDLLAACFGKGMFLIGGENNTLLKATDEADIAMIPSPFEGGAALTGLHYSPEDGLFVATNAHGEIATTSDLETWSVHRSPSVVRIKAITSGANRIVLGDDSGNIYASRVAIEIEIPGSGGGSSGGGCNCDLAGYATEQYVDAAILQAETGGIDLAAYAKLASPQFSGVPKAPTAAAGTATTQIATTKFVDDALSGFTGESLDNLPVGFQGVMAWTDDIVTQTNGAVWLRCNGGALDPEAYPELAALLPNTPAAVGQKMTSASTPAPQVVTDSSHKGDGDGWYAFDGRLDGQGMEDLSGWFTEVVFDGDTGEGAAWWQIDFGTPQLVTDLSMIGRGSPHNTQAPRDFQWQGSNDGQSFTTLLSVTDATWDDLEPNVYELEHPGSYRYYRLIVTRITPYAIEMLTAIREIEFYRDGLFLPNIAADSNGQYVYVKALTGGGDGGSGGGCDCEPVDLSDYATKTYVDSAVSHVETGGGSGGSVELATAAPRAPGTAAVGTSDKAAREDHVHPLQTSVSGNADTATKLATARTIALSGTVTGSASFDGSAGATLATSLKDTGGNTIFIWRGTAGELPSTRTTGTLYFVRET